MYKPTARELKEAEADDRRRSIRGLPHNQSREFRTKETDRIQSARGTGRARTYGQGLFSSDDED